MNAGGLGVHRMYIGRTDSGFFFLILQVIGWASVLTGYGLLALLAVGAWWVIDGFLLGGMVKKENLKLAARIMSDPSELPA